MGVKVVLDDHDFDVLSERAGVEFDSMRKRAVTHGIGAFRLSTLETICRTLDREPGDILVLVDGEGGLTLTENETESSVDQQSRASDKKKYVAIAVTILLVAILTVGGVAIGISQARQAQASPSPISEGHQPVDEADAIKGDAKSAVRANIADDAPDAAIALEAAGRADAARSALATAQEAPATPGSAAGVERPSSPSTDASGKGPNAEAAPSAQPSNPTSPTEPESPSPSHTCSFEPVTESVWQADGTTVTDYSKPSYVWGCNDCGITFASSDACYQHQEEHAFGHHTYSDTVYPTTPGGGYVDKPTGEYKPCPVCGATKQ